MKRKIKVELFHDGKRIYSLSYLGDRKLFTTELKQGKYNGKAIVFEGEEETVIMPVDFISKYLIRLKEAE